MYVQAAAEEQLTTALSEMYVGTWAGRRWYLPTVFYRNQAHGKRSWHMPEKVLACACMCPHVGPPYKGVGTCFVQRSSGRGQILCSPQLLEGTESTSSATELIWQRTF